MSVHGSILLCGHAQNEDTEHPFIPKTTSVVSLLAPATGHHSSVFCPLRWPFLATAILQIRFILTIYNCSSTVGGAKLVLGVCSQERGSMLQGRGHRTCRWSASAQTNKRNWSQMVTSAFNNHKSQRKVSAQTVILWKMTHFQVKSLAFLPP